MRALVLVSLAAILTACAAGNAYGPDSDDRLDMATSGISSAGDTDQGKAEELSQIQAQSCDRSAKGLAELSGPELSEEDRLAGLTGLVRDLRERKTALDTLLQSRPGLRYFTGKAADGATYDVPAVTSLCDTSFYEGESQLDSLVRDVLRMPIVEEIVGNGRRSKRIPKARVDFALLKTAVTALAPADQERLLGDLDAAVARLEKATKPPKEPKKKKRRRR